MSGKGDGPGTFKNMASMANDAKINLICARCHTIIHPTSARASTKIGTVHVSCTSREIPAIPYGQS